MNKIPAKHNPFASANAVGFVAFTIGAEAANVINVGLQLATANGKNLQRRAGLVAYLSDDAEGDDVVGTAPDGGVAIGTDGLAIPLVADKAFQLVGEVDGSIDLNITHTGGAKTCYLNIVMPDGSIVTSEAITFA